MIVVKPVLEDKNARQSHHKIAEDIRNEYQRFNISGLLSEAAQLSGNRPSLNLQQYRTQAAALKDKAQRIIAETVFRTYPLDLFGLISQSEFSSVLPATIAKMIVSGFPDNKEAAISSAELQMYANQAQTMLGQLGGFISFAQRLGVRPYRVPEGFVSVDLKISRSIFNGQVGMLISKVANFNEFMKSVTELATGSRDDIDLVYISTTDPILSCALIPVAAWSLLQFYKLLLEVAEKQINVFKAVRDLKNSGLGSEKVALISKEMEEMIEREVAKAMDTALGRVTPKVDKPRQNEIKTHINKKSLEITADIASGARIYISLESQQQLELIVKAAPAGATSDADFRQQIEEQKSIEAQLDSIATAEQIHALISHSEVP